MSISILETFSNTIGICIATFACFCTWYVYSWHRFKRNLLRWPGRTYPIIGNSFQTRQEESQLLEEQRRTKSHGVAFYQFPNNVVSFVTDFDLLNELFTKFSNETSDRVAGTIFTEEVPMGRAIIESSGKLWQIHRKEVLVAMRKLGLGFSSLEKKANIESDALIEHLSQENEGCTSMEYVANALATATANMINQLCFGKRFDYGDSKFCKLYRDIYMVIIYDDPSDIRYFIPRWIRRLPFFYKAKFEEMVDALKNVQYFVDNEVKNYDESLDEECILTIFHKKQKSMPNEFSHDDIVGCCMDSMFAGTDTTSVTLSWFVAFMVKYPDVQHRVKSHINEVLKDKPFEYKDLEKLPILQACILETQRFGSTAVLTIPHYINKTITTSQGYVFPKGSILFGHLFAIMRDENAFDYPDTFDLRNFLADDLTIKNIDNFIPFGHGPRICVGEKLAKLDMYTFAARFLQTFTVSPIDGEKIHESYADVGLGRRPANFRFNLTVD